MVEDAGTGRDCCTSYFCLVYTIGVLYYHSLILGMDVLEFSNSTDTSLLARLWNI
jgi:hypothetical protein